MQGMVLKGEITEMHIAKIRVSQTY